MKKSGGHKSPRQKQRCSIDAARAGGKQGEISAQAKEHAPVHKRSFTGMAAGFAAGVLNGLLGAGGGMAVVPILEKSGLQPKQAHATSIAVILPLCALSVFVYLNGHNLNLTDALPYIPAGLVGAFVGAKVLPRIPAGILRRLFGIFMLYSAYRLLIR